jgi:hypothetical protein
MQTCGFLLIKASLFLLLASVVELKVERPPSRHLITTLEGHTAPVQGKKL